MHRKALTVAVLLVLAGSVREASAQYGDPWTERGYFNLNIGFGGADSFTDSRIFQLYEPDEGTLTVETSFDSGPMFDFAVGARVWRNVSLGIGFYIGGSSEGAVLASVPHPTEFTDREVALSVSELGRSERAFHLLVGYMLPVNEELSVHVTIGPSFFSVHQDVVSDVTFTEIGPPFTSVNATPVITERSDSPVGFNIGVDATYKLYETPTMKLGAGMFLRYAGSTAKIQVLDNTIDTDVGGVQVGLGGRLRF
jgi:Outer membrane protein beta-barrel domain